MRFLCRIPIEKAVIEGVLQCLVETYVDVVHGLLAKPAL
jgi:hypothetical protein